MNMGNSIKHSMKLKMNFYLFLSHTQNFEIKPNNNKFQLNESNTNQKSPNQHSKISRIFVNGCNSEIW